MLKVQQLLHICSEHYEAKDKEKEDDKDKKDKKDKDKKESAADMGSHQVRTNLRLFSLYIKYSRVMVSRSTWCRREESKYLISVGIQVSGTQRLWVCGVFFICLF